MSYSAGSAVATYNLDTRQFDAAIQRAIANYAKLRQAQDAAISRAAAPAAAGGGAGGGGGGSTKSAEDDALRLAQARARLAQATGDAAGAEKILSTALGQSTGASERATLAVQTQAARLKTSAGFAQQFGTALESSLLSIVGPAAAATAAIAAVSQAGELIKLGAQAEQTKTRFDALAKSAGTTGDALITAMRAASGGTINDLNLQLAANRANLLGVADSAEEMGVLMQIAQSRAQDMGISTTQAFNDLITGLGRGSALILDNLGITVSVTEANKVYAAQLGKTASALSEAEQKQALINAVLVQGKASLEATGGAAETTAVKLERASAAIDNAKSALGQLLALKAAPFASDLANIANALTGIGSAGDGFKSAIDVRASIGPIALVNNLLGQVIGQVNRLSGFTGAADLTTPFRASANAILAFDRSLREGQGASQALADAGRAVTDTLNGEAAGANAAADAHRHLASEHAAGGLAAGSAAAAELEAANAAAALAAQTAQATPAIAAAAEAFRLSEHEARNFSVATAEATAQSLIDATAKEEQAAQTDLVRARTEEAAAAFMVLHPNISASGAASLLAASNIDPLIQQLILARIRAEEARGALAAFNALAGIAAASKTVGFGGRTDADDLKNDQLKLRTTQQQAVATKNYNDMLDAQRDRINLIGTAQQRIAQAEGDLATARARFGATSDEAFRAETKLMQEREKLAREGGRRAGAAGGAARLTAAQKADNQLIDQEEKTAQKLEDLAREHEKKVLDIEAEFQKRSAAQQRANETDKRSSRASFYKTVNVDNRQLSQQVRDQLSAAYEEAYAKAQQLAAAGNAQQANEYLKLKQSQLEAEAQFQADLAEARKSGDKAQVEALIQARELERQAEAEAEKQLLEGGDATVNAKNEQLNEEQRRFEEAQDKTVGASDRATDRIVTNAERRGVALDTENQKLRDQAAIYDRIGTGGGTAPAGQVTPPPPPPPTGAVPIAQPGAELWRVFDQGVIDATNNQTAQLSADLAAVRGAVEALGPRISSVEGAVRGLGNRPLQ